MMSVLYLLRSPSQVVSPALYQNPGTALVISMEDTTQPAKIVKAPPECVVKAGESVSYEQLMALLVETGKVVTL